MEWVQKTWGGLPPRLPRRPSGRAALARRLDVVHGLNFESKAEKITLSGTNGFQKSSGTVPAKTRANVCVTKGYAGTLKATLKDGKKLTVHF
jgi:hypothetical protein